MWQRWNGTSHVFEKSDDNGSSWAPLPLSAATITEGILSNSRLSGVAILSALNVFTLAGNHRFGSGSGAVFVTVNGGNASGAAGAVTFERSAVFQGAIGGAACIIGGTTNDMLIYCPASTALQIFTNAVQAVTISSLGDMLVGPGGTPSAINYGARIAASVDRNALTAVAAVNQSNTSGAAAGFIFSTSGNSWIMVEGSSAKNGNALTWELDITAPVVRMTLYTSGMLFVTGGFGMVSWPRTVAAANVQTGDSAPLYISTSSLRFKTDIETISLEAARAVIKKLRGITYRGVTENDNKRRYAGFGAEEVAELDPVLVTYDKEGKPDYVTYDRVPAYLVPVTQDHEARLLALEARLNNGK